MPFPSLPRRYSSSNPIGALANTLLGSSSKTQERLKELPGATVAAQNQQNFGFEGRFGSLLGSEDYNQLQYEERNANSSEFMRSFHSVDPQGGFADAWNDVQRHPQGVGVGGHPQFAEFNHIYENGVGVVPPQVGPASTFDG